MNPPKQIQEIFDRGLAALGETVPRSEAERLGLVKPEATRLDAVAVGRPVGWDYDFSVRESAPRPEVAVPPHVVAAIVANLRGMR